eukprot:881842-Alexandrium_andersonii.AAC.1
MFFLLLNQEGDTPDDLLQRSQPRGFSTRLNLRGQAAEVGRGVDQLDNGRVRGVYAHARPLEVGGI